MTDNPIASAPAMAEEIKRLTKRVEWFTHAIHTCHDECDRPLCKTTRERDALRAELERKDAALREITELEPRPSTLYPPDWSEQIAACPECQRYKDHPIQRGICDTHRKPIYATERHNKHEIRILGYRAKDIARAALSPAQKEGDA